MKLRWARQGVCAVLAVAVLALVPSSAAAQQSEQSPVILEQADVAEEYALPEGFDPGVWPTVAAIFPGFLFHGIGLWAAGAPEAGYDLARISGVGQLVTMLSFIGVYGTGASRRTIELLYYPSLVGITALAMPWLADIYGSSVGGRHAGPRLELAPVEARVGYAYVYDPVFDYSQFTQAEAKFRLEPIRLVPSAWIGLNADNQRLRLEANGRIFGPRAGERPTTNLGSFLDVDTATTYWRFDNAGFDTLVLEAQLAGRYDMRRLSAVFRGSFFELSLGAGAQFLGYDAPDGELGEDVAGLLLMKTAYGIYFGPSGARYGEAKLYYNHRHDDLASGIALNTQFDGVLGYVGAEGFYYLSENWGAFAEVQAGSAYVALGGVTFRLGGQ